MSYLLPAEYEAYGLAETTADAWVTAASAMIEAHCRRPSLAAQSYVERMRLGRGEMTVRLSYGPVAAVTAVRARFGNFHHGLGYDEGFAGGAFGVEAALAFCAVGTWTAIDVTTVDVDAVLGEVRLPWNMLGAVYGEAEISYTAGFAEVPAAVKVACAQIVKNAQATPGLNVKSSRVDTLQMQYFSDSLLDTQVKALLQPYVAERLS